MKTTLTMLFSLLLSMPVMAEETTLQAVVCGDVKEVAHWTYERSYNTKNGVYDRQGYIKIAFRPVVKKDGSVSTSRVTVPVKDLYWGHNFRTFYHASAAGTVLCAQKSWWGLKKDPEACDLERSGAGIRITVNELVCADKQATVVPFKFIVR